MKARCSLRRLRRSLLVSLVALPTAAFCVWGQENLVSNPGFELAPAKDGLPAGGWWVFEGRGHLVARTDQTVSHSGAASAQLHADADTKAVLVSRPFDVGPGDHLAFAAWLRADAAQTTPPATYAGLAFRDREAKVISRAYFASAPLGTNWARLAGDAVAPADAATAEVHLGYTNAPATIWYDDVAVAITNPISLSLLARPESWTGQQDFRVRIINRQPHAFTGSLECALDKSSERHAVKVEPNAVQDLKLPVRVSGIGPHTFALNLLDATARPAAELRGKFRTTAALELYPACPCYHRAGSGNGDTRVDARINVNPAERLGMKLLVELSDASGHPLQVVTNDAGQGEFVGCTLRVPTDRAAGFVVLARLLDHTGSPLGSDKTEVRVAEQCAARATFGPDGVLRLDGVPQLPLGLYSAGRFEEMARAGFTVTHSYSITTGEADPPINPTDRHLKELLDQSWTQGLRLMVELPRKPIEKARWEQVRRRINTFKNHPGLLCWGSEERVARGAAPLANIARLYKLVKELDPDHPLVLGDTRDVIQHLQQDRRNFFPEGDMDAGIWWWYPFPLKEPDGNGLEGPASGGLLQPPAWLTTTVSKKPLWIAIQAYQKPSRDAAFPTAEQYRCLAYLSLIYGAKGVFFYTGYGQRDYLGKPAGLLNKPDEAHWDYVQRLVHELREFTPLFTGSQPVTGLEVLSPKDRIECMLRESNGQLLLLAANRSAEPATLVLRHPAFDGTQVEVLYEPRRLALNGNTLTDQFTPFATHIYRLFRP